MMLQKDTIDKISFYILVFLVIAVLYSFIGCPFYFIFGVPCAACGTTRALVSLFRGDIMGAFQWHPLFWLMPPFVVLLITKNSHICKDKITNNMIIFGIAALCLGVYVYRMIAQFPHTEPMTLNEGAILIKILSKGV